MGEEKKVVLIVEDNQPDYEAVVRAFKKLGSDARLYHCDCGEDAVDYLTHQKKYSDPGTAPRPDIILLDLNLPGLDGRSVLKYVKNSLELKTIPVVVLTTSSSEQDIQECYKNGANGYVTKPVDWDQFLDAINNFRLFWLKTAVLPS